jgi:ABC-type phosphate transport system substrate-binding protein
MVGKWQRVVALGGVLSSAIALFSAAPALAGPNGTFGGPTPDHIFGSGSDTTSILMLHLDGLYITSEGCNTIANPPTPQPLDFSCQAPDPPGTITSENYEHDVISEYSFLGSGAGIKQLCTQGQAGTAYLDFARSSRAPKASDCTGLHFVAYARDGISVEASDTAVPLSGIHGMNNPDPLCTGLGFCLTQTQIKGIYANCTITNWNQVGGNNQTIIIYTPQANSGTRQTFETFLGISDSTICITTDGQPISQGQVPENQNSGIKSADYPGFIFEFSFGLFHTEVNPTNTTASSQFLLAAVDGIPMTVANIEAGSVPYSRFLFNVFCSTTAATTCGAGTGHIVTQKTVDYVGEEGWICKPGVNENPGWIGNQNIPALDGSMPDAQAPHVLSPHYNTNWVNLIIKKIQSRGFGTFAIGQIGSGDTNTDHCRLTVT